MVRPIGRRRPIYDRPDPNDEWTVREYVEERFREAGWFDKNKSHAAITHIKSKTFEDSHHIILHIPVVRKEIPIEMLQLADEVEDELDERGYLISLILRPTVYPWETRAAPGDCSGTS